MLDVEQNIVEVRRGRLQRFPRNAAAGFHRGLDAAPARFTQKRESEILLQQRFAAGNGHAAAGAGIKNGILRHHAEHILHGTDFAVRNETLRRAGTGAGNAFTCSAMRAVDGKRAVFGTNGTMRAGRNAEDAFCRGNASPGIEGHLRPGRLRFRVAAPAAGQGAALGEHDGAYARPVVYGIFLDIEHHAGDLSVFKRTHGNLMYRFGAAARRPGILSGKPASPRQEGEAGGDSGPLSATDRHDRYGRSGRSEDREKDPRSRRCSRPRGR